MDNLHVTYGVYANGSWKRNVVAEPYLADHVKYNLTNRPGRCLVVDRKVIHTGYLTQEEAEAFLARIPILELCWWPEMDSAPYV